MYNNEKKIFIADDNADIRGILDIMLKKNGYTVVASDDPADILRFARSEMPDLILLDLWLAGADGRVICERLKKDNLTKRIPVIFVSADSNIADISKEYQANGFIAKPFEMGHLLDTITSCLTQAPHSIS